MSCNTSLIIDLNGEICQAVCMDSNNKLYHVKTLSGSLDIPTVVSFEKNRCLVGEEAIKHAEENLSNTIFSPEQYLQGNKDPEFEFPRFTDAVQYTQIDYKTMFSIVRGDTNMKVYLEEIFSYLIAHLIDLAKAITGAKEISKVVILTQLSIDKTIRCYDIETYWRTQEILRTIGMDVEVLTIEKSFLYEQEYIKSIAKESSCVVFNFEHEAFSINDTFKLISSHRKYRKRFRSKIEARDCEYTLVQYCLHKLKDIWGGGENIKKNHLAMYQIREACRKAIVKLSSQNRTAIKISINQRKKLHSLLITRKKLGELCHPIFQKIVGLLEDIYPINNDGVHKLEALVLIGDMTAFPKLENMIIKFFQSRSTDIQVHKSSPSEIFDLAYRYKKNWEIAVPFNRTRVKKYKLPIGYKTHWGFTKPLFDTRLLTTPNQFSEPIHQKVASCDNFHTCTIDIYEGKSILNQFNKHITTLTVPYVSFDSDNYVRLILTVRLSGYGQIVLTSQEKNNPYNRTSVFLERQNQRYTPGEIRDILQEAENRKPEERELIALKKTLSRKSSKFDTLRNRIEQIYPLISEKHGIFESSTIELKKQLENEIEDAKYAYIHSARDVALEYFELAQSRIERQFEELETRYLKDIQKTVDY